MTYQVNILASARRDFEEIIAWIAKRSPEGAGRLVERFEDALSMLVKNPLLAPLASESEALQEEVRHIIFHTRAGRNYRALFLIVDDEVRILRVRGAGEPPITRDDIETN